MVMVLGGQPTIQIVMILRCLSEGESCAMINCIMKLFGSRVPTWDCYRDGVALKGFLDDVGGYSSFKEEFEDRMDHTSPHLKSFEAFIRNCKLFVHYVLGFQDTHTMAVLKDAPIAPKH
jgi:hypothetical protein